MYQRKFLVCENLLGNKPHSDSDSEVKMCTLYAGVTEQSMIVA